MVQKVLGRTYCTTHARRQRSNQLSHELTQLPLSFNCISPQKLIIGFFTFLHLQQYLPITVILVANIVYGQLTILYSCACQIMKSTFRYRKLLLPPQPNKIQAKRRPTVKIKIIIWSSIICGVVHFIGSIGSYLHEQYKT